MSLPLHIDKRFEHFITDGDDLGVGLETALGDNHAASYEETAISIDDFFILSTIFSKRTTTSVS